MDENEIPVEAVKKGTPTVVNTNTKSGKFTLLSVFAIFFIAIIYFAFSFIHSNKLKNDKVDLSQLKTNLSQNDTLAGGAATPEYAKKVNEKNTEEAQKALANGTSNFPTPVNEGETGYKTDMTDEQKKELMMRIAQQNQQTNASPDQQTAQQQRMQQRIQSQYDVMLKQLDGISTRMELPPQKVTSYLEADKGKNEKASANTSKNIAQNGSDGSSAGDGQKSTNAESTQTNQRKLDITPGTLLYAVNDLQLSSEGANPEARATVLSGQYKNWVAIGSFESKEETMRIKYTKLISTSGEIFTINAYGVPPDTDTAVIGNVDHHYIERWGGLVAASFLQGFGQATQLSGVTGYGGIGMSGTAAGAATGALASPAFMSSFPQYSLSQKAAIAAGVVGTKAGTIMAQNFNRPNTITLPAGEGIGILVI
ncbi:TrbI/VirB10 family protein [Candidatus Methylospira mobilis]|uniref:DotG/IcmE/VirB10 family protein n=1 Tax=Candidatus Methylospira mobilis TaxID=1808979 RepID=UPI0028EB4D80|nr:TrbI/VirB10 family protein [Candidatus Methylospira mobilis]WNV05830.1 TrbI/VirB10 family protein [Candidatus Methylospira mobilis]